MSSVTTALISKVFIFFVVAISMELIVFMLEIYLRLSN